MSMQKLSKSHPSKTYLEKKSGKKSQPISTKVEKQLNQASIIANKKIKRNNIVYNQSNSHSNETVVCEKASANSLVNNIDKIKNPHTRDYVSLSEKFGSIEDYSKFQEQKDLKRYKEFISNSTYDDIKETESEIGKQLTLSNLRK